MKYRRTTSAVQSGHFFHAGIARQRLGSLPALALFAGMTLGIAASAQAKNDAWSTNPADGTFTGTNWTLNATTQGAATGTIASTDTLYFGTSNITTLTDNEVAGFTVGGFTFNTGSPSYAIGGSNGMTLTGGITDSSTSPQTITDPISVPSTHTITTMSGGGDISLGGLISGAGGFNLAGGGTLTLSSTANSYGGSTTVNAGTLMVTGNTPAGGAVTVGNGSTLDGKLAGTGTIGGPATINAGSTITSEMGGPTGPLTLSSTLAISGTYAVDIGTAGASDRLVIGGKLTIGSASSLLLSSATLDGSTFDLATYSSETGTFASTNVPVGYALIYLPTELELAPIPEPSSWLLTLGAVGLLMWQRSRRSVVA